MVECSFLLKIFTPVVHTFLPSRNPSFITVSVRFWLYLPDSFPQSCWKFADVIKTFPAQLGLDGRKQVKVTGGQIRRVRGMLQCFNIQLSKCRLCCQGPMRGSIVLVKQKTAGKGGSFSFHCAHEISLYHLKWMYTFYPTCFSVLALITKCKFFKNIVEWLTFE